MNEKRNKGRRKAGSWLVLGFLLWGLGGCGWFSSDTKKEQPEGSADALIQEGLDAYQRQKYEKAVEAFQTLKDRYPYSQYADSGGVEAGRQLLSKQRL